MFLICGGTTIFAQPVINSSIHPNVGMELLLISAQYEAPSAPGPNQTWTINPAQLGTETYKIEDPITAPGGGQVIGADIALTHPQVSDFYSFANQDLSRVATYFNAQGLLITFTAPELVLPLPLSYQESVTRDFFGTYDPGGQPSYRIGTVVAEAEAYGTLNLMGHTFTDVLRVRVESTLRDSTTILGSPVVNPITLVTHYYIKNGVPFYLMYTVTVQTQTGTQQAMVLRNPATVDVGNPITVGPPVVYPNPATDVLNIAIPNVGLVASRIDIYNTSGQLVSSAIPADDTRIQTLNISHLPAGVYMVRMDWNGSVSTYPFVKQ